MTKYKYFMSFFFVLVIIIGWYLVSYTFNAEYNWWSSQKEYIKTEFEKENSKAKILFILNDMSATGAPMMALRLSKVLRENGYAVGAMYGSSDDIRPNFESLGIPVINAYVEEKNEKYFQDFAKEFDLVIVNSGYFYLAYQKSSEVRPTIWWIHDLLTWVKPYIKEKYLSGGKISEKSLSALGPSEQFFRDLEDIEFIELFSNADIVTVSEYSKMFLHQSVKKGVEVINNGVDDAEIEDSLKEGSSDLYHSLLKDKNENNKIVFLQVGMVISRKAVHLTLEAIKRMPKEYQDKLVLYIIGNLEDDYASSLMKKYANFDNIKWIGQVSRDVLNDYYRVADVLTVPSSADPSPCVITEAAMYGVPAIISNKVGSTYIIKDNDSGYVFEYPDVITLKERMMYCIDNPDSCKKMGKKAKQYFYETSTKDMFAKKWLEKIENKLKEKGLK